MEDFKNINWLTSIEDIIDDGFLDEERLQNEGVMYKIMNGVFQDPFQDLRPFVRMTKPVKVQTRKRSKNKNKKKLAQNKANTSNKE